MIKRPENHIKETNSKAYIKRTWSEWAVNEFEQDYGIDLDVIIFENNESTDINFPVQLKSTDNIIIKDGKISFSLDTDHLIYFFNQPRPLLFVLYDNQKDTAYWIIIQDYVWDFLNEKKPNWRNQSTNTLYFPIENKVENKEQVKQAVINAQKRIIQENWFKLSVGEGLGLQNTLSDINKIEKFEKKAEQKIKESKLILADLLTHQGNIEDAIKKVQEIYNQNNKDLMHLKAIITLSTLLIISDPEQNRKRINLCMEGIDLSKKLNNSTAEAILIILKNKGLFLPLIQKSSSLLYRKKISSITDFGQLNHIFIDKEFEEITKLFINLNDEINRAVNILIKNEEYYILIYSLCEILDIFSMTIPEFKLFDSENKILKDDIKSKLALSKQLLNISEVFNDKELTLQIKGSVASVYYWTEQNNSVDLMKDAIKLAKDLENQPEIERLEALLEFMETNPEPFKGENPDEILTNDLPNILKESLKYQGFDLSAKDEITEAALSSLNEADPEKYLMYCENMAVAYSASPLGQMVGLPCLGHKLIYCSVKDVYMDWINLAVLYDLFTKQYCEKCEKRTPRDSEWKCTMGILKKMEFDIYQKLSEKK